jgi:hypothetical protein
MAMENEKIKRVRYACECGFSTRLRTDFDAEPLQQITRCLCNKQMKESVKKGATFHKSHKKACQA